MDRGLAVALTALVGGLVAIQAPINSGLGRHVGTFQAAFVSFFVGTVALCVIASVSKGGIGQITEGKHAAWYSFTGGLLGACYVTCVLVTVRSLGAGGVTAATIAGQLAMAMVVDQLGILGVAQRSIDAPRVIGLVLLAAGVFLIVRR